MAMGLQLADLKETTVLNAGPALAVKARLRANSGNVQNSVIITLVRRQALESSELSDNYLSQACRCGCILWFRWKITPKGSPTEAGTEDKTSRL
jgi:hypothetical protein